MNNTEAEAMIDDVARKLGEHFPNVQIMCSWPSESGGTKCAKRGYGDWYARRGMAHEFINEDIANDTASNLAEKIAPPPDDEWKG